MVIFVIFLILMVSFTAAVGIIMFGQWCAVQNQAQFVAESMGKWGGYTTDADRAMREFADRINVSKSRIDIEVSNVYPVPWGTPVWVRLYVPFNFSVGNVNVGRYTLEGVGRSVSSYMPGSGYSASYVYP